MKNSQLVNDTELDWDDDIPSPEYFAELMRVSKHQIIWGGNYFPLPQVRGWIVWDKKQPWDNFSQVEMAWTSIDMPAKLFSLSNRGGANDENKIHPTQKPTALYNYCYDLCLKVLDEVKTSLDTHLGSGTNRVAAGNYGLDFYGCDNKQSYFDAQEKRHKLYTSQQRMFS
jgi:site-specific DNA-methyltransferase (adenine-specific)